MEGERAREYPAEESVHLICQELVRSIPIEKGR